MTEDKKLKTSFAFLIGVSLASISLVAIAASDFQGFDLLSRTEAYIHRPETYTSYEGYYKINSINEFMDGSKIVLGTRTTNKVMGSFAGISGNHAGYNLVSASFSEDKLNVDSSVTVLTMTAGSNNKFYLYDGEGYVYSNGDEYLIHSSTQNKLDTFLYSIEESSSYPGYFMFQDSGNTGYPGIKVNTADTMLTSKNGRTSLAVYTDIVNNVKCWANTYLHMSENTAGQCNDYYSPAKAKLLEFGDRYISALCKDTSLTAELERYEAWAKAKQDYYPYVNK